MPTATRIRADFGFSSHMCAMSTLNISNRQRYNTCKLHEFHRLSLGTHRVEIIPTYFCRVRLRLWVADLILFWASRWVMLSVLTPSMATTRSPWFICDCAALLPGVICVGKDKRKSLILLSRSVSKMVEELAQNYSTE